jgi:hypothetical protein
MLPKHHYPQRQWTVYLIHHTHTDLGYTDTPERIRQYHLQYFDDVLEAYRLWKQEGGDSKPDFVWTIECFWSVEQWLARRDKKEHASLVAALKDGYLGLSTSYLHFTELIDYPLIQEVIRRATHFGEEHGIQADTALSADVNGYSWGYSQALFDANSPNLISFLHSHHGYSPIGVRQSPFWWETPKGDRILVWNGEHYILGNVMGLVPGGTHQWAMADNLMPTPACTDTWDLAQVRLTRYLRQLENDNYPEDFVLLGLGGSGSDNSPPNFGIKDFITRWNESNGEAIRLEMTTPSAFMQKVRYCWKDIPTHRGDWPDWWTDGIASMPGETSFNLETRRRLERLQAVRDHHGVHLSLELEQNIKEALILYSEHTFCHSDSMRTPWDRVCRHIESSKRAIAARGLSAAVEADGQIQSSLGEVPMRPGRPFRYRVVNPFDQPMSRLVRIYIENCEFDLRDLAPIVIHVEKNIELPVQRETAPRGWSFIVRVKLEAREIIHLDLQEGIPTLPHKGAYPADCALDDGPKVDVIRGGEQREALEQSLSQKHCIFKVSLEEGIHTWSGAVPESHSLFDANAPYPPLTPVYERTPVTPKNDADAQCLARTKMGRNRKGKHVERFAGVLRSAGLVDEGAHCSRYKLDFELPGSSMAEVFLDFHKEEPEAEVSFRIHKDSVWDPENVYLALPFSAGENSQIWLNRAGAPVRPVKDQLPETLTDWYALQSGYAVCGSQFGIAITSLDAPLLQLGPLDYGIRELANGALPERKPGNAMGYLMTNYWETNFPASLAGFYEFRYRIRWSADYADPVKALAACRHMERECYIFRTNSES